MPGGTRRYVDLLFSHWRADYARILAELVNERLTLDVILAELDAILTVAGSALADDPWITGSADDGEQLRRWWSDQHAAVAASVRAL